MSSKYFLGIDTSNYTTSVALIDSDGNLAANLKQLLPVKPGERGLRQSDALFEHTRALPLLLDRARDIISGGTVMAVGVSTRPRNREGSYMPCFLAGASAAHAAALGCGAPMYEFSHQCGHIMAALYSAGREIPDSFGAFHISGGTTELVRARAVKGGFACESAGGTRDLNAGQVIDRLGVYMGFPFPCGKYIEKAALANTARIPRKKPHVCDTEVNLSGLENIAVRLYDETKNVELTSAFILDYLSDAILSVCENYRKTYGDEPLVFAGGVMSNSIIRKRLGARFDAAFAEPELSCDNAVGIAVLAKKAYDEENNH